VIGQITMSYLHSAAFHRGDVAGMVSREPNSTQNG